MPRENSFSDSEGRSLTPDLEDEVENYDIIHKGNDPAGQAASTRIGGLDGSSTTKGSRPNVHAQRTSTNPLLDAAPDRHDTMESRPGHIRRPAVRTTGSATDRFRTTARKIIQMRRTYAFMSLGNAGAEPGVDPKRDDVDRQYRHIQQECTIEIIDFNRTTSKGMRMTNGDFVQLMHEDQKSKPEPWVKVRWINVGGVSWDVIKALALRYNLHPLAVEDVLHTPRHSRSKSDYYNQHLFLRVLCHSLAGPNDREPHEHDQINFPHAHDLPAELRVLPNEFQSSLPSGVLPVHVDLFPNDIGATSGSRLHTPRKRTSTLSFRRSDRVKLAIPPIDVEKARNFNERGPLSAGPRVESQAVRDRSLNVHTIEALKRTGSGQRVDVKIQPICVFLMQDGTVISIHPNPDLQFTLPISRRLRQAQTILRSSADGSFLVQSILDLIVDRALEIVDEYQARILALEQDVLLVPNMDTVKFLHILQGDLILHKRTMQPIKTLVYYLRRYDVDRYAALWEGKDPKDVKGYMSYKAKTYLADVNDHMEYILTSLDMFAGIADNLINYTFNMASNRMNEIMRQLTVATVTFLPLTLLTGYFGMNFQNMWTVKHNHTDVIFWIIALPVMAIVVPLFLWVDIQRASRDFKKRMIARTTAKDLRFKL
ncbi:hypothetical protein PUNSTDRAFT_129907 [Punctularia strigosozonata HHB-11173 SS5]|uniref:uncharacterized protein n=1 Tax=Punctularia strigosozonata (strain HHB-11173) TaxID=741275 RepID=UPI0004417CAD|nr:uncharacterized protein PUNSTDRAFT_129907 [Punctularia strigosozonata HHB-11173 SS5]EIN14275.1 hypothetical protein PUNSTDRAFT_129907 [Punctularia strigosozonata HHB-11173 SS5]